MAGFAAYIKVDGFNILPVMSFSMAATTFTGQNIGAGKIDRVKKGMWVTLCMGIVYTIVTGVLLLSFSHQIIGIFTKDADVIYFGTLAMWYFCPFYSLLSIMHEMAGTIRGTGKTIPPMAIILFSLCIYRVLWVQFVVPHFDSIRGVYIAYPISWGNWGGFDGAVCVEREMDSGKRSRCECGDIIEVKQFSHTQSLQKM